MCEIVRKVTFSKQFPLLHCRSVEILFEALFNEWKEGIQKGSQEYLKWTKFPQDFWSYGFVL